MYSKCHTVKMTHVYITKGRGMCILNCSNYKKETDFLWRRAWILEICVYKRESPKALKMVLDKRKVGFIGSWGMSGLQRDKQEDAGGTLDPSLGCPRSQDTRRAL